MDLGEFPIALMALVLLIPVMFCGIRKKNKLKEALALWILSVVIVVTYPVVTYSFELAGDLGYTVAKIVFFVLLPIVLLMYLLRCGVKDVLATVGVRRKNLESSIRLGLLATVVVIAVTVLVRIAIGSTSGGVDLIPSIFMFIDAFSEEFLFRGIFFLYLMTLLDWRIAAITSILAFVLVHSQHFGSLFIVSTIVQAILMTWVAYRTKNIIGPWISHGLNRFVPSLILGLI